MDFATAVTVLSQVHDAEVQQLRARVADLESRIIAVKPVSLAGEALSTLGSEVGEPVTQQANRISAASYHHSPRSIGNHAGLDSIMFEKVFELPANDEHNPLMQFKQRLELDDTKSNEGDESERPAIARWSALVRLLLDGNVSICLRTGWSAGPRASVSAVSNAMQPTTSEPSFGELKNTLDFAYFQKFLAKERTWMRSGFIQHRSTSSLAEHAYRFHSQILVLHPASRVRIFWVMLCFVCLSYEIILVTLEPFGFAKTGWAEDIDKYLAAFWIADILLTFASGEFVQGKVERRFRKICRLYLRSWFLFDALAAALQCLAIFVEPVGRVAVFTFLIKGLRFSRIMRLARMSAWMQVEEGVITAVGAITFRKVYGELYSLFKLIKYLFCFLLYLHCNACAWYGVGRAGRGWVVQHEDILKGQIGHDYLVAFHWAAAQFQGNVDVVPGPTTGERVFACISIILALLLFSFFLSHFTELLVSLKRNRDQSGQELSNMHKFLNKHDMPLGLRARANHYLHTKEQAEALLTKHSEDESALKLFPMVMRQEMQAELLAHSLAVLPVFAFLKIVHPKIFVNVCASAIAHENFAPEDDLFLSQEAAKNFFVITEGEVVYNTNLSKLIMDSRSFETQGKSRVVEDASETSDDASLMHAVATDNSRLTFTPEIDLTQRLGAHRCFVSKFMKSDSVNEAVMWTCFRHEGDLNCLEYGQCLRLDSDALLRTIQVYSVPHITLSRHAQSFMEGVVKMKASSRTNIYIELIDSSTILAESNRAKSDTQFMSTITTSW